MHNYKTIRGSTKSHASWTPKAKLKSSLGQLINSEYLFSKYDDEWKIHFAMINRKLRECKAKSYKQTSFQNLAHVRKWYEQIDIIIIIILVYFANMSN